MRDFFLDFFLVLTGFLLGLGVAYITAKIIQWNREDAAARQADKERKEAEMKCSTERP